MLAFIPKGNDQLRKTASARRSANHVHRIAWSLTTARHDVVYEQEIKFPGILPLE